MELKEKLNYVGTVIGMQEAADSFVPTHMKGVGKMYCHNVEIGVEAFGGEVVPVQVCTERPQITEFEVNDEIRFQVNKFTQGRYSVKFVEKLPRRSAQRPQQFASQVERVYEPTVRNPVVSGTAIERASSNAAHLLQMRGNVTDEQYIALTEKLYQLYIKYCPQ